MKSEFAADFNYRVHKSQRCAIQIYIACISETQSMFPPASEEASREHSCALTTHDHCRSSWKLQVLLKDFQIKSLRLTVDDGISCPLKLLFYYLGKNKKKTLR